MPMFYVWLAVQVLKKILPALQKKAQETPNKIDDSAIALVELAIELYDTGKLSPQAIAAGKSRLDV